MALRFLDGVKPSVLNEKDPGRPHINRLRIIHLFEADFNYVLTLQWGHRLVRRAWELDIHQQFMQPESSSTIMHGLTMMHRPATIGLLWPWVYLLCGDAESCHRTLTIQTHAEALEFMPYTVKRVHGISESNYQKTDFAPLYGTGQESGVSPGVWLTLVVILLNTLDRLMPDRINFQPLLDSGRSHQHLVDAFVDDTSLGMTSTPGTYDFGELIDRSTTVAQTWEHLLHLSGGKLNLSQCLVRHDLGMGQGLPPTPSRDCRFFRGSKCSSQ